MILFIKIILEKINKYYLYYRYNVKLSLIPIRVINNKTRTILSNLLNYQLLI